MYNHSSFENIYDGVVPAVKHFSFCVLSEAFTPSHGSGNEIFLYGDILIVALSCVFDALNVSL